jgi:hypothetical protein
MSELPDEMKTTLTNLDTSLSALEEHLDPLFEIPWDVLTARLEPMEKAKLNLMMAYSAASLFYMYLKSQVVFLVASLVVAMLSIFLQSIREYRPRTTQFNPNLQGFIRILAS